MESLFIQLSFDKPQLKKKKKDPYDPPGSHITIYLAYFQI